MNNDIQSTKTNDQYLLPDNFIKLTEAQLSSLRDSLGLSMPQKLFAKLGKCMWIEKIEPELNFINLFEELWRAASKSISNIKISDFFADDTEIIRTLSDLYSKATDLEVFDGSPMSIENFVSLSQNYFEKIGISSPDIILPPEEYSFSGITVWNNSKEPAFCFKNNSQQKLPYGYIDEEKKSKQNPTSLLSGQLSENTVFAIIYSKCNRAEYLDKYNTLVSTSAFKKNSQKAVEINELGILTALLTLTHGVSIDMTALPFDSSKEGELSTLVSCGKGYYIIAFNVDNEDALAEAASECDLELYVFAKNINKHYVVINNGIKEYNVKQSLFRSIAETVHTYSVKIEKESFSPTDYTDDFSVNCADGSNCTQNDIFISTLYSNDNSNFVKGINVVIDSVLPLLLNGIDRRNIGLTFKYGLPASITSIGKGLALILGAYRAMMELCIPDKYSSLVFNDLDNSSVLCTAYGAGSDKNVPKTFVGEGEHVYLLTFARQSNSNPELMPDFDDLRKMCDHIAYLSENGDIKSARTFNGSIKDTVTAMCNKDIEFIPNDTELFADNLYAQGIIIETSDIINAKKLGTLRKLSDNNEA